MIKSCVNVLGTIYQIRIKKYSEEECFARRHIDGFCDGLTHEIVICDMSTYKDWDHEPKKTVTAAEKQTLRHEIVHAFFNESGLADSSFTYDGAWAKNEEMVDWLATQGAKVYRAWREAGAL